MDNQEPKNFSARQERLMRAALMPDAEPEAEKEARRQSSRGGKASIAVQGIYLAIEGDRKAILGLLRSIVNEELPTPILCIGTWPSMEGGLGGCAHVWAPEDVAQVERWLNKGDL